MELSPEQMSEREQRRTEIEQTFDYEGYQVARRELFAHLRDPAIVIRKDSVSVKLESRQIARYEAEILHLVVQNTKSLSVSEGEMGSS